MMDAQRESGEEVYPGTASVEIFLDGKDDEEWE